MQMMQRDKGQRQTDDDIMSNYVCLSETMQRVSDMSYSGDVFVFLPLVVYNKCSLSPHGFPLAQHGFTAAAGECSVISISIIN